MADKKMYKVGITVKEPWSPGISYEALDITLYAVESGGDGCSYIAIKANQGVTPGTDDTVWVKATQRGQSIYDLAVKYGDFEGTEAEFEAEYEAAVHAAQSAAQSASAIEAQVETNEAARVTAERARSDAETARSSAETARINAENARNDAESLRDTAESDRVRAESGRVTAEASRVSAETFRQGAEQSRRQQFEGLKTDMETAIDNVDAKAAAIQEDIEGYEASEAGRVSAESSRVSAENSRVSAEESRAAAETARVTQANSDHTRAETDHNTATTDHSTAESDHTAAQESLINDVEVTVSDTTGTPSGEVEFANNKLSFSFSGIKGEKGDKGEQGPAGSDAAVTRANIEAALNGSDGKNLSTNDYTDEEKAKVSSANGLEGRLASGDVVPALVGNLESWDGSNLSVEDTWSDTVRTTAGDVSIDSSEDGRVVSVAAKSLVFSATAMRATGFNLLHDATAVGTGYYFLVPALPFGTFGTASKPNGLLFTDANGDNLRPTVVFKAIGSGVPTSVSDGVSCPYTDSNGYRFYNPTGIGYIIVSGITPADTCAHIAWSGRYDEFISPSDSADAGTTVSLTALINAVHPYGQLLNVGGLADRIEWTGDTTYKWTRNNDRTTPTWVSAQNEDETYTHTATISTMLAGGRAYLADGIELVVDGQVVSITNDSATAPTGYVYFNLAKPATGTGTADRRAAMEDWGLEEIVGASGEAFVTTQYKQGIPDTLRAMASVKVAENFLVVSEAIAYLSERVASLENALILAENRVDIICRTINATEVFRYGVPVVLECAVTGAPAAARVPKNWDSKTMGVWTGVPRFVGQMYSDKAGKKVYFAPVITNSVNDWVLLN